MLNNLVQVMLTHNSVVVVIIVVKKGELIGNSDSGSNVGSKNM